MHDYSNYSDGYMSESEIRSLQKIKGGSYVITLPRWWVERTGVKKGQKIFVVSDPIGLRLIPQSLRKLPEVELYREDFSQIRHIRYAVFSYYMQGVSKITIYSRNGFSPDDRRELRKLRGELLGADIVEDTTNKISLKFVASVSDELLHERIARMARFAYEVHRDTLTSLRDKNLTLAGEIVERIDEIMRQYRATYRYLTLSILNPHQPQAIRDVRELAVYSVVIRDLYMAVYYATQISRTFLEIGKDDINKEIWDMITKMYEVVVKMYENAVEAFTSEDVKFGDLFKNAELFQQVKAYDTEINSRLLGETKMVNTQLLLISRSVRRSAGYAIALTDDIVNRQVIKQTGVG